MNVHSGLAASVFCVALALTTTPAIAQKASAVPKAQSAKSMAGAPKPFRDYVAMLETDCRDMGGDPDPESYSGLIKRFDFDRDDVQDWIVDEEAFGCAGGAPGMSSSGGGVSLPSILNGQAVQR